MPPRLPDEIWSIIASFLPWFPSEKRWQAWVLYRTVNRIFKQTIEEFYIKEWLWKSMITIDCDETLDGDDFERWREFEFKGFSGPANRLAEYHWEETSPGSDRFTVSLMLFPCRRQAESQ